jgi:hypothetical protein
MNFKLEQEVNRRKGSDNPKTLISEDCYREWIEFIFGNWVLDSDLYQKFYKMSPAEIVELIKLTCLRCGTDLQKYSNSQINYGLNAIFSQHQGDLIFSFQDKNLRYEDAFFAIHSFEHLYTDLFNQRCDPVLCHLDESTDNHLNNICYMIWDVTPLMYWDNPEYYYRALIEVMEKALYLSNPACVESALHGLGHIHHKPTKELVERAIDKFLKKHKKVRPELIEYAKQARTGYML